MAIRDALKLSVVPLFFLCLAGFLVPAYDTLIPLSDTDLQHIELKQKLMEQLQGGVLRPTDEQIVALIKVTVDVERARNAYDEAMSKLFKSLANLIGTFGLVQLVIVFSLYRRGRLERDNEKSQRRMW